MSVCIASISSSIRLIAFHQDVERGDAESTALERFFAGLQLSSGWRLNGSSDREEFELVRQALQGVPATTREAQARARDKVLHRARDEDFIGLSGRSDTRAAMNGDAEVR